MGVYRSSIDKGRITLPPQFREKYSTYSISKEEDFDFDFTYLLLMPTTKGQIQLQNSGKIQLKKQNLDHIIEENTSKVVIVDYHDRAEILDEKNYFKYFPQNL